MPQFVQAAACLKIEACGSTLALHAMDPERISLCASVCRGPFLADLLPAYNLLEGIVLCPGRINEGWRLGLVSCGDQEWREC